MKILVQPKKSRTSDFNALRLVVSSILIVFACSGVSLAFQAPGGRGDVSNTKTAKPTSAQPAAGTSKPQVSITSKKRTAIASKPRASMTAGRRTLRTSGQRTARTSKPQIEKPASLSSVNQPAPVNPPVEYAGLTVSANPPGTEILLNGQPYESRDENGNLVLNNLKPGSYTIQARKAGYREQSRTIALEPKQHEPINLTLEPLPGSLSVKPSVAGAEIVITNLETNSMLGSYMDQISEMTIAPGRYQVSISKNCYGTEVREVTINPTASITLEPSLKKQRCSGQTIQGDARTIIESQADGKYLIVSLTGKSGDDTNEVGTLDVTVNANGNSFAGGSVTGTMLPGFPCEINFQRLENVAEYSWKESPSPSNQWGRVVVRVRPKDSKRPIHFTITWRRTGQDQ